MAQTETTASRDKSEAKRMSRNDPVDRSLLAAGRACGVIVRVWWGHATGHGPRRSVRIRSGGLEGPGGVNAVPRCGDSCPMLQCNAETRGMPAAVTTQG